MSAKTKEPFAVVHLPVLVGKQRAAYVAHRSAQEWFVGGPSFIDDDERQFTRVDVAALSEIVSEDILPALQVGEHAFRHGDDQPWHRGAIPSGRTFLVTYDVRPTAPVVGPPGIGGAYANCWIVCASLSDAKQIAANHLEGEGWAIVDTIGATEKLADDLAEGTEPYFRQVQIDGIVAVMHTFPASDPDADVS
jgi:hypothetical protein